MKPRLLGLPASPNTRKILAAAHALDVEVELQVVDYFGQEHRRPPYLALNPNAMIPTMVHGDFVLWESNAIVNYLADQRSDSTLSPRDPKGHADCLRWQFWQCNHWGIACEILAVENLLKPLAGSKPDRTEIVRGERLFHQFARVLDAHLGGHAFLVGDSFTIADIAVATYLEDAPYAKYPLEPYARIRDYWDRLCGMECWKATAPDWRALGL
jgi:glutathione S-transferase